MQHDCPRCYNYDPPGKLCEKHMTEMTESKQGIDDATYLRELAREMKANAYDGENAAADASHIEKIADRLSPKPKEPEHWERCKHTVISASSASHLPDLLMISDDVWKKASDAARKDAVDIDKMFHLIEYIKTTPGMLSSSLSAHTVLTILKQGLERLQRGEELDL